MLNRNPFSSFCVYTRSTIVIQSILEKKIFETILQRFVAIGTYNKRISDKTATAEENECVISGYVQNNYNVSIRREISNTSNISLHQCTGSCRDISITHTRKKYLYKI